MSRNSINCSFLLVLSMLFFCSVPEAVAGGKTVIWYLDGTRVQQELQIDNSYGEIILPPSMKPGSLRISPLAGTRVTSVDLEPVKPGKADEKELARIEERREALLDRIKALSVKEEIYKAAAKSQGSKAPKRTRTNPEPLSAIRQGTDFAIERLEEVYRSSRKVERELKGLDQKAAAMRMDSRVAGTVAKLRIAGKRGKVQLSYLKAETGWIPSYDLRFTGESAELILKAKVPGAEKNDETFVAASLIAAEIQPPPIPFKLGSGIGIATYRLPIIAEKVMQALQRGVSVTLRNDTGLYLPPGDSSGFYREEFIGFTRFVGLKPSETVTLTYGSYDNEGSVGNRAE